jgi:hypothetical protein
VTFEIKSSTSVILFNLLGQCVELDLNKILPVRRPITRSKRTGRGKIADVEHECTHKAESINEFFALRLVVAIALYNRCVVQPFVLKFTVNGKRRRYTPDFLLIVGLILIVVEVKSDKQAAKPANKAYFRLIRALLAEHGFKFLLWRRSEIMQEPRLNNVGLMLRYRRTPVLESDREAARSAMGNATSMSFAELSARSGVSIQVLCRLVLEKMLFIDWLVPVNTESLVSTAPIGQQVWPSPKADLPDGSLSDDSTEDRKPVRLDDYAIALARTAIQSMSVDSGQDANARKYAWWHSRTRRAHRVQHRA